MEDKKKSQPKKKHTARNATIGGAAVLLLLLGGFFGFGQGLGLGTGTTVLPNDGSSGSDSAKQAVVTEAPAAEVTAVPEAEATEEVKESKLVISVSENKILFDGEEVGLASLEEELKNVITDGKKVELKDDHAIKAAYDAVVAALEKLDIPYTTAD